MMRKKIRLIFVIFQFDQGGSERYLYELCKALNKDKFEIEILTKKNIKHTDYYYFKLKRQGISIHNKLSRRRYLGKKLILLFPKTSVFQKVFNLLDKILLRIELNNFFEQYDLICFIQIENYYLLQQFFNNNSNIIIHLMSHQIQYEEQLYTECLPNRNYRFVLADRNQKRDLLGSEAESAEIHHFPLVLDMKNRNFIYRLAHAFPIKIAVFTRLSPQKPIDFFLYAFNDLLESVDATLHIYGRGNPNTYTSTLNMLNIQNKVFFEGHRVNLEKSITQDRIGIGWMLSIDSYIGYASIELASFGLPLIFRNLYESRYEDIKSQTNGIVHSFHNISDFVDFNKETINHPDRLLTLGKKLREYVYSENDVVKHIHRLENLYRETVSTNKTVI
ncbi:MAG: hypothetical protein ACXAC5_21760 [Promethearchaeota archaeon]|jgi:glycosyltransferase involved in cell wall biosynthesis